VTHPAHTPVRSRRTDAGRKRTQELINGAHAVLTASRLTASPSKVAAIVKDYQDSVEASGCSFFGYLGTRLKLSAEQRGRVAELDYLDYRPFKHPDPIGEHATNRALGAGRRKTLHANN
jgi:hypothetical protein